MTAAGAAWIRSSERSDEIGQLVYQSRYDMYFVLGSVTSCISVDSSPPDVCRSRGHPPTTTRRHKILEGRNPPLVKGAALPLLSPLSQKPRRCSHSLGATPTSMADSDEDVPVTSPASEVETAVQAVDGSTDAGDVAARGSSPVAHEGAGEAEGSGSEPMPAAGAAAADASSEDDEPDDLPSSDDDDDDDVPVRRRGAGHAALASASMDVGDDDDLFIEDADETGADSRRPSRLRKGAANPFPKAAPKDKAAVRRARKEREERREAKRQKREQKKAMKKLLQKRAAISGAGAKSPASVPVATAGADDESDEDAPIGVVAAKVQQAVMGAPALSDGGASEMEYSDSDEVSDEEDSNDDSDAFSDEVEEEEGSAWSDEEEANGRKGKKDKVAKEPKRPKKVRKRSALSDDEEPPPEEAALTGEGEAAGADGSPANGEGEAAGTDGNPAKGGKAAAAVPFRAPPTAAELAAAAKLKDKFSAAPRKDVDTKLLKSSHFLVVGSVGRVASWKLPYKDRKGRVNVHLLEVARQVRESEARASTQRGAGAHFRSTLQEHVAGAHRRSAYTWKHMDLMRVSDGPSAHVARSHSSLTPACTPSHPSRRSCSRGRRRRARRRSTLPSPPRCAKTWMRCGPRPSCGTRSTAARSPTALPLRAKRRGRLRPRSGARRKSGPRRPRRRQQPRQRGRHSRHGSSSWAKW